MKYFIISQGRGAPQPQLLVVVIAGLFTLENVCCQSERRSETESEVLPYCRDDYQCQTPFKTFVKSSSRCSCHPFCKIFQDCCYDVDSFNKELNIVSSSLLETLSSYKDFFECTTDVTSSDRYWMVSRCPPSWSPSQNKCRLTEGESEYSVGNFQDLTSIPVVSNNGVTFRNIFCAICHGHELTSVTPWSLTIDCIDIAVEVLPPITNLTLEEKLFLLNDICGNLTLVPPPDHLHNVSSAIPCRRSSNTSLFTQTSCSENGLSDEECNNIHAPLDVYGKLFKNHYCAKCFYDETGINITFIEFCDPNLAGRECYLNDTGGLICTGPQDVPLVPISITFNFFGQGSGVSISSEGDQLDTVLVECGEGQVFDPTSYQCLQLSCPTGYQLEDNRCIPNNHDVIGNNSCDHFHLTVTLKLKTDVDCSVNQDVAQLLGCLPDELLYVLTGTNLLNDTFIKYTCEFSQSGIVHISINQTISDVQAQQLFWPNFPLLIPLHIISTTSCRNIDAIDLSSICASSDVPSECRTSWQNDKMWDMSNFTETVQSQVRLRRTLRYFDNGSLTELFSLQRCRDDFQCPLVTLNASLFFLEGSDSDTLVLKSNRSIRFTSNMYTIDDDGTIKVCNFLDPSGEVEAFFPPFTPAQSILSTVGIVMSIIALLLTLTTYLCFPPLRTRTASILVMILCVCLIIAQFCLLFAGIATSSRTLCAILAGVGHFFWLAAFSTSCIFGFALDRTFSLKNQTYRGHKPSNKTLLVNFVGCFIFPTLISGTLLVVHLTGHGERYSIYYGNEQACWIGDATINFLSFGLPVLVSLLVNIFLFSRVVYALCAQHRNSRKVRGREKGSEIREFLIYVKILVVLSLTWIVGYIASLSNQQLLWYIFIVLTSLQGVFIFLAFTVKSQVLHLWKEKFINSAMLTTSNSSQYNQTASSSL